MWTGSPGTKCPHGHSTVATNGTDFSCVVCGEVWPVKVVPPPPAVKHAPKYTTTQGGDPLVSYDGGKTWQSQRHIVGGWKRDADGIEILTVHGVNFAKYPDGTVRSL